ncbi:hypothetical protein ACIRBX_14335 [Kitasatospora sp. NPDC096147]|uniref:hypothetical protein n=1 Tax=Kitasatospora sp. NPDC096147 TaxID=3364093 RepID=UPI003809A4F6
MYERGKGSQTSEQVVDLLAAAAQAADGLLADLLADHLGDRTLGGPVHRDILRVLAEHGPHARPDLAARTGVTPEAAEAAVDDLLAEDLVSSMTVHVGGRRELVLIAPSGQAALDCLESAPGRTEEILLASLTRGERGQLAYLLRRVCASAQAHRTAGAR